MRPAWLGWRHGSPAAATGWWWAGAWGRGCGRGGPYPPAAGGCRLGVGLPGRGDGLVLAGRLVPGLRAVVSVPAGMGGMSLWGFLLRTAIGSLVWNAGRIGVGAALAAGWAEVAAVVAPASAYLLAVSAALVPALWLLRRRLGVGAAAR